MTHANITDKSTDLGAVKVTVKVKPIETITIPISVYRDLKRRATERDELYKSNAARGAKRWEGTTPEQRKAHMAALAAKRKAKS